MNITSQNLLSFIEKSPSPFHSVASICKILLRHGFIELKESDDYQLKKGGKYYVIRNQSSIIAFKIGKDVDKLSFNIVASHSDCPSFKVKANGIVNTGDYSNLSVEGYGGMLCATWFDRPLSLAGRVVIKENESIVSKLINFDENLLSIPSVAIHMNHEANSGYKYNMAVDMQPTISRACENVKLNELIANKLEIQVDNILGYDLYLYNHQQGYFWGVNDQFISSPKLDDLQCAYTTLLAFVKGGNNKNVSVYCCFDNEEVGSSTRQGADSSFLDETLKRISMSFNNSLESHYSALSQSMLISADNAHAIHPTHPEYSDSANAIYLNAGIVIKYNASQTYCSDAMTAGVFKQLCVMADVPYQQFANRSDKRGGSTLGNISATHVSIPSVDIGLPQLAMHSSCETAGALDGEYMLKAIIEFYNSYLLINNESISIIK